MSLPKRCMKKGEKDDLEKQIRELLKLQDNNQNYPKSLLEIYVVSLFRFYETIPYDYIYKDTILYFIDKTLKNIEGAAPELLNEIYRNRVGDLGNYMPTEDNEWNIKAWNYLLDGSKRLLNDIKS